MSDSKDEILGRVRNALKNVPENEHPEDVSVSRAYLQEGSLTGQKLVSLFARRTGEYKAKVRRIKKEELKSTISVACREQEVKRLVIPPGFPPEWLPDSVEPVHDKPEEPLTHQELDESDGVITTCALAIAQTGSIILDAGEGQGRRALTLLPDYHLCIVREDQVVELVPEAFVHFDQQIKEEGSPMTFISGPSATSDIELNRVEGVHGPRRLEVFIVGS
ncbi:lactate utilization protein C [Aliifodinibius sp. S!AR15-10]|uniref:LutC/YkgG family protein n=1 Tax=Aliifodinibius sp. S!AR15-10 TaxID=2950437 RepID=UPI002861476F|nr:lactate utilization protein C [Aliifodinibius sp. S!AR15-10]MDR8390900.1 lactate utilization protein C [Aliifodinibius sp. S!AR15-10]